MKACIKMEKIIKYDDIEIQKQKFHQPKRPISIKNIDINKTVVSNKVSFGKKGFKYFIGCKDDIKIRPLCIFFSKMSACRRDFDETKYMSILIKDDELLEKYNEIWEKVKNSIKKEFDSEPVHSEKYLKVKIKSCNGKINTNFQNNKIPKEGSQFICLSVILVDSIFRKVKIIILTCFQKNVIMLLKKKRCLSILLMT